jgi:hypothetical protein
VFSGSGVQRLLTRDHPKKPEDRSQPSPEFCPYRKSNPPGG